MNPFTPELSARLPGPSWLQSRRAKAAGAFCEADMPSSQAEEWRYSPIEEFDIGKWKTAEATSGNSSAEAIREALAGIEISGLAICRDGWLEHAELTAELEALGVRLGMAEEESDLEDLPVDSPAGLLPDLSNKGDIFSKLTQAFSPNPVVLNVPRGVDCEGVIVVLHEFSANQGLAVFPWLSVKLGENASANVLELTGTGALEGLFQNGLASSRSAGSPSDRTQSDRSHTPPDMFVCPLVTMRVPNSARLRYLNVQSLPADTWQIASQLADVGSQATLVSSTAALGGSYARLRTDCSLSGRGATGDIVALSFADENQTIDFRTFHSHIAPDTSSNLLFKGAIDDEARSIYTGLIRVGPEARGTNAFQTNRNLKLSDTAWAESVPNLEIENNDVACSHASTVGPVEEEQMFYLQSRGVPDDVAERLIVDGFFAETLDALPLQSAVPMVRRALHEKLPYEFAE